MSLSVTFNHSQINDIANYEAGRITLGYFVSEEDLKKLTPDERNKYVFNAYEFVKIREDILISRKASTIGLWESMEGTGPVFIYNAPFEFNSIVTEFGLSNSKYENPFFRLIRNYSDPYDCDYSSYNQISSSISSENIQKLENFINNQTNNGKQIAVFKDNDQHLIDMVLTQLLEFILDIPSELNENIKVYDGIIEDIISNAERFSKSAVVFGENIEPFKNTIVKKLSINSIGWSTIRFRDKVFEEAQMLFKNIIEIWKESNVRNSR
jgi:hypothetical protein